MMLWFALIGPLALLVVILFALKLYCHLTKAVYHSDVDISGKIILITGGNTGIGLEFVLDMARRNATIILAVRSVARGEAAAAEVTALTGNRNIHVEHCDLSSLAVVSRCCDSIRRKFDHLDVFWAFAASVGVDPAVVEPATGDGLQRMFQCNYLSHFLMMHKLISLIHRSEQGRILMTSSDLHRIGRVDVERIAHDFGRHVFLAYGDSKLALNILNVELARRLAKVKGNRVTVNAFHPGSIVTNGVRGTPHWYTYAMLRVVMWVQGKTVQDGARPMIYLTLDPRFSTESGGYYGDCKYLGTQNAQVEDRALARDLWQLSLDLLKPYLASCSCNGDENSDNNSNTQQQLDSEDFVML